MNKRLVTAIALIWSVAFLIGANSHFWDIAAFGWRGRPHMPDAFNIYWTSLLPLDLLAAILIWWKRRAGVVLAMFIMLTDVAVNSYAIFVVGDRQIHASWILQSLFLIFVLLTAPLLWRKAI